MAMPDALNQALAAEQWVSVGRDGTSAGTAGGDDAGGPAGGSRRNPLALLMGTVFSPYTLLEHDMEAGGGGESSDEAVHSRR